LKNAAVAFGVTAIPESPVQCTASPTRAKRAGATMKNLQLKTYVMAADALVGSLMDAVTAPEHPTLSIASPTRAKRASADATTKNLGAQSTVSPTRAKDVPLTTAEHQMEPENVMTAWNAASINHGSGKLP